MLEEIVTLSSLIVHKDHTKLDYIPLSAQKQHSPFRVASDRTSPRGGTDTSPRGGTDTALRGGTDTYPRGGTDR